MQPTLNLYVLIIAGTTGSGWAQVKVEFVCAEKPGAKVPEVLGSQRKFTGGEAKVEWPREVFLIDGQCRIQESMVLPGGEKTPSLDEDIAGEEDEFDKLVAEDTPKEKKKVKADPAGNQIAGEEEAPSIEMNDFISMPQREGHHKLFPRDKKFSINGNDLASDCPDVKIEGGRISVMFESDSSYLIDSLRVEALKFRPRNLAFIPPAEETSEPGTPANKDRNNLSHVRLYNHRLILFSRKKYEPSKVNSLLWYDSKLDEEISIQPYREIYSFFNKPYTETFRTMGLKTSGAPAGAGTCRGMRIG